MAKTRFPSQKPMMKSTHFPSYLPAIKQGTGQRKQRNPMTVAHATAGRAGHIVPPHPTGNKAQHPLITGSAVDAELLAVA